MDLDTILLETEEQMEKSIDHLKNELRGVRTGRASTGLVEHVKIEAYGAMSDLKSLARLAVSEGTQIVVTPFDPSTANAIAKGIEAAGLGLNPQVDGKVVRINVPALSGDRRKQLVASVKQMGEQAKVSVRNARRDANKNIDATGKDKTLHYSEDQISDAKDSVQDLIKKYENIADDLVSTKSTEIETV